MVTGSASPHHQVCPRCKASFVCRADAIQLCHCNAATLSDEERSYIQQCYTGCLCADCIKVVKEEYRIVNNGDGCVG